MNKILDVMNEIAFEEIGVKIKKECVHEGCRNKVKHKKEKN